MCAGHLPEDTMSPTTSTSSLNAAILARLTDAHAHPSDRPQYRGTACNLDSISQLKGICAMSSTLSNQNDTTELYDAFPDRVIPAYGVHPWFTHHLSLISPLPTKETHYSTIFPTSSTDSTLHPALTEIFPYLPDPTSFTKFLIELEENLSSHPTALVGEIGFDKAFHIPTDIPSKTGDDGTRKSHSSITTPIAHQVAVAEGQIALAIKHRRNVSFHSVRASGETVELLKRLKMVEGFDKINLCLHSFGGSVESAIEVAKVHSNVYFSFATVISGRSPRFHDMLRAIPANRLLLESDLCNPTKIDAQMMEGFEAVCEARRWSEFECIDQIEGNWEKFRSEAEIVAPVVSRREKKRMEADKRSGVAAESSVGS